ncbi:MAG: hypothetical protein IT381_09680 [Deltaproteobacteria bacterium]|nr:hypothetical protein [Deltaproteobacteria bacterium]
MLAFALALAFSAAPATASPAGTISTSTSTTTVNPGALPPPTLPWRCRRWNGTTCNAADRQNTANKQLMILGSGFAAADESAYWSTFDRVINLMTQSASAGTTWSVQKRDQLLFIGYFIPSTAIGTKTALFGASLPKHPIRGYATSLDQSAVYKKVQDLTAEISYLKPIGVAVVFNSFQDGVTANAAPPTVIGKPFGVAKWQIIDLDQRGAYLPVHELGHASMNFLDEYVEKGFDDLNIAQLDVLTPLALLDGTWGGILNTIADIFGVYDMRISEILANNGSDNIATRSIPATVDTPGFAKESYKYEGGMFFGRGTWHMAGANVMNGNRVQRGPDDIFGFSHSPAQNAVVQEAFGATPHRPNDRLRNTGPTNGWPSALGSETKVMIFDGDKLHHFHPTRTYTVQVGWWEREWHTCWKWDVFPYPCSTDTWRVAEKTAWAAERKIELKATAAYGLASLLQGAVCAFGIQEIKSGEGTIRLCDQSVAQLSSAFLPTIVFRLPYQEIKVPASQWFTKYYWRFHTDNGVHVSGNTGWSSFYRTF